MKSRDTLVRLKKFQVDEKRRRVAQIEMMIAEFGRMAGDLDREIAARGAAHRGQGPEPLRLFDLCPRGAHPPRQPRAFRRRAEAPARRGAGGPGSRQRRTGEGAGSGEPGKRSGARRPRPRRHGPLGPARRARLSLALGKRPTFGAECLLARGLPCGRACSKQAISFRARPWESPECSPKRLLKACALRAKSLPALDESSPTGVSNDSARAGGSQLAGPAWISSNAISITSGRRSALARSRSPSGCSIANSRDSSSARS